MAAQTARISTMFAQIEATQNEVQESVVQAMGYLAYSRGPTNYPYAARSADEALNKAIVLTEEIRALRTALGKVNPSDF
jgi:hypothetical protein